MEQILKIIACWLGNISSSIPYVKAAVLQVTSLNCLYNIVFGFICLGVTILLLAVSLFYLSRCKKWARNYNEKHKCTEDGYGYRYFYDTPLLLASGIPAIISLLFGVSSVAYLSDFWQWTCIYHSDLYLIHLAAQKVLG